MKKLIVIVSSFFLNLLISSCLDFIPYAINENAYECSKSGMDMNEYCKRKYEVYELFRNDVKSFLSNECDSDFYKYVFSAVTDSMWLVKCKKEGRHYEGYFFLEEATITVCNDTTIIDIGSVLKEDEFDIYIFSLGQGIVNDNGSIHIDVVKEGIAYGWGQMDFFNGKLNITTGIY